MVKDLKLILNQLSQQLIPGSEVSGVLSFQVTEEAKSYSYVKISLFGRAHVSWSEITGNVFIYTPQHYSDHR